MLKPSLIFILITVFIDVLGIGLMIPVLPTLIGTMTSSLETQAYWFGLLAAAYGVMQFLCTPLLGALSDQYGRRPVLLLSIMGLGFSYIMMAMVSSLYWLLFARLISGATGASFSVANAYVTDISEGAERNKGFGLIGAAFGMGFIIGPVLGGLLGDTNIHLPFYMAAALSLTNMLYGYFVLPESLLASNRSKITLKRANPFSALVYLTQLKGVGWLVVVFGLTMLAQSILQSTWVLYTEHRFHWTPKDNGYALFAVGVTSVVAQAFLLGRLTQFFGKTKLLLLGMLSAALVYMGYGLANHSWQMYTLITLNVLSFTTMPLLQSFITRVVSVSNQGMTQGALNALNSIMMVVAPLFGTALLANVSHLDSNDWRLGITFFASGTSQLLAIIVAVFYFYNRARRV